MVYINFTEHITFKTKLVRKERRQLVRKKLFFNAQRRGFNIYHQFKKNVNRGLKLMPLLHRKQKLI